MTVSAWRDDANVCYRSNRRTNARLLLVALAKMKTMARQQRKAKQKQRQKKTRRLSKMYRTTAA